MIVTYVTYILYNFFQDNVRWETFYTRAANQWTPYNNTTWVNHQLSDTNEVPYNECISCHGVTVHNSRYKMDFLCVSVITITNGKYQQQHNDNTATTTKTTSTVATKTSNDVADGGWTCEEINSRTFIDTSTIYSLLQKNLKLFDSMLTRNNNNLLIIWISSTCFGR